MSATVIPFERRAAKAHQGRRPTSTGARRRNRSARLVAVSAAIYGFTVAAAIELEAFAIGLLLIVGGFLMLRRL